MQKIGIHCLGVRSWELLLGKDCEKLRLGIFERTMQKEVRQVDV
jgi:hypothetical protein